MIRTMGSLALAATLVVCPAAFTSAGAPDSDKQLATKSAAWRTVDGKLVKINGEHYVIEDDSGKELRLHVSKETAHLGGEKKPGDRVRAEITKSGHALSIQ